MLKFIIPVVLIFLIVLFWEKINQTIFDRFKIKLNYLLISAIILIIAIIILLLNN